MSTIKDWTGFKIGKLAAVEYSGKNTASGNRIWKFSCECGGVRYSVPNKLKGNANCGCFKGKDITGNKYGKLTAVERLDKSSNRDYNWLCKCDCGKDHITTIGRLQSGHTTSCGCAVKEGAKKREKYHGMKDTLVYNSWRKIKERCFNEKDPMYQNYGAKGISMKKEWAEDFKSFYNYIGDPPDDGKEYRSIDRIDNSKGYEDGNIRWATTTMQARNKTLSRVNTTGVVGVTWEDKVHPNKEKSTRYAVAQWKWLDGKPAKKCFSVKKYGEELAFFLACEMRELAIERLNAAGAGYTENHGK